MIILAILVAMLSPGLRAEAVHAGGAVWLGVTNESNAAVPVCISSWSMKSANGLSGMGATDVCREDGRGFRFNLEPTQTYAFRQPLRPVRHGWADYQLSVFAGQERVRLTASLPRQAREVIRRAKFSAALSITLADKTATILNHSKTAFAISLKGDGECEDTDVSKVLLFPGRSLTIPSEKERSTISVFDPEHACHKIGELRMRK